MSRLPLEMTYIGGPTAVLQYGGIRFLTDPTFDPPGGDYGTPPAVLHRIMGPALSADAVTFDIVLLSHDHHFDNLDHQGRASLSRAKHVITTEAGAGRLGGNAIGLANWAQFEIPSRDGRKLTVTATPARHGPAHMDRGPVIGFILQSSDAPDSAIYVAGDTVWYEGVGEVCSRFPIDCAVLFMGAARVPQVGPWHLTMTAEDGIEFARSSPATTIVPLHYEGWRHFSESKADISAAFAAAGLANRLRWLDPGRPTVI